MEIGTTGLAAVAAVAAGLTAPRGRARSHRRIPQYAFRAISTLTVLQDYDYASHAIALVSCTPGVLTGSVSRYAENFFLLPGATARRQRDRHIEPAVPLQPTWPPAAAIVVPRRAFEERREPERPVFSLVLNSC